METSPTIKEIAAALVKFEELQITVTKDATNPHFRSKFASLDNIIESIREPLAQFGLVVAQFPDGDGLTTILTHTSGEWMKATANLKLAKEDPQGQGSAYTYARRYALSAILGLATDEDDDGNEATRKAHVAAKTAPTAKPAAKADAVTQLKKRAVELLKELEEVGTDKEQIAMRIQARTDLDPADNDNLPEIIDRLNHLVEEQRSK